MNRNSWTSPFGLAFLVGSLAALVAGFATGSGMRAGTELNMATPSMNLTEPYVDENALIAANREPTAPATPPPAATQAPAPSPDTTPAPSPAPTPVRNPSGEDAESDVELLPPEPRDPPRRRRNAEPPLEEEPSEEPQGF